jgi:hypothetical protein
VELGQAAAIRTGVDRLDDFLAQGGLRAGLYLLGGPPGAGKTAFGIQLALRAAAAGHLVLYVSVDQGAEDVLARILCRETGRPVADYWNAEPGFLADASFVLDKLPLDRLHIVGGQSDPAAIGELSGAAIDAAGHPPLIVVDYLQRLRTTGTAGQDRRLQVSAAADAMRHLARNRGVPVLVLSSVNRASYHATPDLSAFKESGDLEFDADAAFLLHDPSRQSDAQDEATDGSVELHIVKNRLGPETRNQPIVLHFDRALGSFRELGSPKVATTVAPRSSRLRPGWRTPEQVADTCRRSGGRWASVTEARRALRVSKQAVAAMLRQTVDAGLLVEGHGTAGAKTYAVVEQSPSDWPEHVFDLAAERQRRSSESSP